MREPGENNQGGDPEEPYTSPSSSQEGQDDTIHFFHEETEIPRGMGHSEPEQEELIPGLEIPGYTLVRELSKGGQAVIFLATQNSTGRKVAVKLLLDGPVESQTERTRMDREVRVLAELDHPNIVSVIDRGTTTQGLNYFVMEYLKGSVLAEYMDEYHAANPPTGLAPDISDILRLFVRICETVNAAHLRGIVHRDLKPANIIIDSYAEPHIFDFGVASGAASWLISDVEQQKNESSIREFLGSLPWASPEQAEGDMSKIDTRTDVYSLGVILYEMLTGQFPYEVFGKPVETLFNIRNAIPAPPGRALLGKAEKSADSSKTQSLRGRRKLKNPVDSTLDAIVLKALEKRRDKRYQTAGALAQDLTRYMAGQPVSATGKAPPKANDRSSYHPIAMAMLLIAAVGFGIFLFTHFSERNQGSSASSGTEKTERLSNMGYVVDGDTVRFKFRPSQMETVRRENGALGVLNDIKRIMTVGIAGEFNNWDPFDSNWKLSKDGPDLYTLERPLSDFAGRSRWHFKFVVNGSVWVSAPSSAPNRVIVPEDTATYNFILTNPKASASTADRMLTMFRNQIDQAWPGVGDNLADNGDEKYFLSLTHLPSGMDIDSLQPLQNIPLSSLDMADVLVTDFSPLSEMTTLKSLVINAEVYQFLVQQVISELGEVQFDRARKEVDAITKDLLQVPVFHRFRQMMMDSIDASEQMRDDPSTIPAAAHEFNGHSYAMILLPVRWGEAYSYCRRFGGHLVTISDEEELGFLLQQFTLPSMGRSFWIGASDQRNEGIWEWVTGEKWSFQNWSAGEPNNRDGQEHYVAMQHDGWWFDADGSTAVNPFIIEWDHVPEE